MKAIWDKVLTQEFLIEQYENQKKSYYEIAREVGCSPECVRKNLIKQNVKRRSHRECMLGRVLTEEWKQKISESNKGKKNSLEHIEKYKIWRKEHHDQVNKAMSISLKKKWQEPEFRKKMLKIRKHQMTPEVVAKIIKTLEKRGITSLEQQIIDIIEKFKLPFKFCGSGGLYIHARCPDFVDTGDKKMLIEVFYEYFKIKQYGSVEEYCKQRYAIFKQHGYETLFLAQKDLRILTEEDIANQINNFYIGGRKK